MFLVTWVEGEEVNYRFINEEELPTLLSRISHHVIVQDLNPLISVGA